VAQLSLGIDGEDARDWNLNCGVSPNIVDSVSVSSVEGVSVLRLEIGEEFLDVSQASNLEVLGLLDDDLAMEGVDQGGRVEEEGAVGQVEVTLGHRLQVVFGDGGLADGPGAQVSDVIPVVLDFGEQGGDTRLSPVSADDGEDVAEDV